MGLREDKKNAAWHEIRDAAWRLFEERGYAEVSVEQIASAAGVSRSTYFNYFGTKESVVLDPSPEEVAELTALMESQPSGRTPWEAVTDVLLGVVAQSPERLQVRRRMTAHDPALERRAREMGQEFARAIREWLRERRPEDVLGVDLAVDLALAAAGTAWSAWPDGAPVSTYVALTRECLDRAGHLAREQ